MVFSVRTWYTFDMEMLPKEMGAHNKTLDKTWGHFEPSDASKDTVYTFSIPETDIVINCKIEMRDNIVKNPKEKARIVSKIMEHFEKAYAYLYKILGNQNFISKNITVEISNRERHGAQGALFRVSAPHIRKSLEINDEYQSSLQDSLFIHELLHNLTDAEDVPMLAEFTFILEKGQTKRFQEIERLHEQGLFPPVYTAAMGRLAEQLGYSGYLEMLRGLSSRNVLDLKNLLNNEVLSLSTQ